MRFLLIFQIISSSKYTNEGRQFQIAIYQYQSNLH